MYEAFLLIKNVCREHHAWNNVKISSILEQLSALGIDQRIIRWMGNMLKDRVINSNLGIGSFVESGHEKILFKLNNKSY